ncbi:UNVERIFIED_CONTAM: hypothetical protein K2H54_067861 [Gekko kuhli]
MQGRAAAAVCATGPAQDRVAQRSAAVPLGDSAELGWGAGSRPSQRRAACDVGGQPHATVATVRDSGLVTQGKAAKANALKDAAGIVEL